MYILAISWKISWIQLYFDIWWFFKEELYTEGKNNENRFYFIFFAKNKVRQTKVLLWKNLVCLVLNSILFFSMVLTNMYGYSKLMFCESAITNVYVCSIVVWVFFSNFEEGGPGPVPEQIVMVEHSMPHHHDSKFWDDLKKNQMKSESFSPRRSTIDWLRQDRLNRSIDHFPGTFFRRLLLLYHVVVLLPNAAK